MVSSFRNKLNSRRFEISKEQLTLIKSTENLNYTFIKANVPYHSEQLHEVRRAIETFSFLFLYDTSPDHLLPSHLLSVL